MLKKLMTSFFCMLGLCSVQAQSSEDNALYLSGEFQVGNYFGLEGGINYIHRGRTSFKLAYSGLIREPRSQPEDFNAGLIGASLLGLADPFDELGQLQLTIGRIYPLNISGSLRLNFNVGIGITSIREPSDWQRIQSGGFGTNYEWDYNQYKTLSLIINPKLEIPFTNIVGISVSPILQINKDRVYIGIGIGSIIGALRSKSKPRE